MFYLVGVIAILISSTLQMQDLSVKFLNSVYVNSIKIIVKCLDLKTLFHLSNFRKIIIFYVFFSSQHRSTGSYFCTEQENIILHFS